MLDTRQKILEAAILVLNDDLSASIDKIAVQAGVTRRTLHRYFRDRQDLFDSCLQDMRRSCQHATSTAYASSSEPRQQLERLLYAGIDCGTKYAFLHKLHLTPPPQPTAPSAEAEPFQPLHHVLRILHQQGAFTSELTVPWMLLLFSGVVQTTIEAEATGAVARQEIKKLAWRSFSQAIGLDTRVPAEQPV
ncbi:TetR/AcrR family transcriptional regulator [Hymenobacter sp. HD11105]|jgi:AcrR family transcriptional regulator